MSLNKTSILALLARSWRSHRIFWITLVIPTLLSTLYFTFIASDMYVSESRFVVRSPDKQNMSSLGALFSSSGFSRSSEETSEVASFILSRDAMYALDKDMGIKKRFSSRKIDLISRFAPGGWFDSYEDFYLYYLRRVDAQLDPDSSIVTLTTRAFTAKDAHDINLELLEHAEALVNRLNERSQQDRIRYAANELAGLEKRAKDAAVALAGYRNAKGVIDPEKQAGIPMQQIAKLQDELVNTRARILQIESVAPQNPQLPVLRRQAALLEAEIKRQTLSVVGAGDHSLAGKATEYQRLVLDKEFADKMLAGAMATLEQARSEALRKQLYVERVEQPSMPDMAMEPHRIRDIFATLLLGLVLWGVATLTVAAVREHTE
jgi:capsular polysaccharide transport system permease protein